MLSGRKAFLTDDGFPISQGRAPHILERDSAVLRPFDSTESDREYVPDRCGDDWIQHSSERNVDSPSHAIPVSFFESEPLNKGR